MKKKFTRILFCSAILLLLFSSVTTFGAEKASEKKSSKKETAKKETSKKENNKKEIKARAEKYMKAVKKYDVNKMLKSSRTTFTNFYVAEPVAKVVRKMNRENLKYTLGKAKVDGAKGSVKVNVKYFDGYDVFKNAFISTQKWYARNSRAKTEQVRKKILEYALQYYKKASKKENTKSTTLNIKMKHISKGWYISSITGKYDAVVNGNYDKAYNAVIPKKKK